MVRIPISQCFCTVLRDRGRNRLAAFGSLSASYLFDARRYGTFRFILAQVHSMLLTTTPGKQINCEKLVLNTQIQANRDIFVWKYFYVTERKYFLNTLLLRMKRIRT